MKTSTARFTKEALPPSHEALKYIILLCAEGKKIVEEMPDDGMHKAAIGVTSVLLKDGQGETVSG
jgi:hypothetical protein